MMAKRIKHSVRSHDDFELGIRWPDGRTVKVFALREGESIPNRLSTNYDHHWNGPALVYTEESAQGWRCDEHHVNDPGTWAWIGLLIHEGLKGGGQLISKVQVWGEDPQVLTEASERNA